LNNQIESKDMASKKALAIIDMQNDFVLPGASACVAGAMQTIPNIVRLLAYFRSAKQPIFYVVREYRHDGSDIELTRYHAFIDKEKYVVPGTKGCDIVDELNPKPGEHRLVKNRFSAFMNTELDFMLRRFGVNELVVCGTQYPNCIRTTVYDAVAYGYETTLITDAASAQTDEIAKANMIDIANIGVNCMTTEDFVIREKAI
jgi:nicotinamidase-related amidase